MEKDIQLGSFGKLALSFSGGKAVFSVSGGASAGGLAVGVNVSEDATVLIDLIFASIEKASPAGAVPIEEGVKTIIKSAVAAIG